MLVDTKTTTAKPSSRNKDSTGNDAGSLFGTQDQSMKNSDEDRAKTRQRLEALIRQSQGGTGGDGGVRLGAPNELLTPSSPTPGRGSRWNGRTHIAEGLRMLDALRTYMNTLAEPADGRG
jgi:hypothetical protein